MVLKQASEEAKEIAEPSKPGTFEPEENDPDQIDTEFDAVDDTAELYRLTGKPVDGDVLVSAVPVCAPYHTLSQYTFRVKLTPGNLKRGKAAKQCLDLFTKGKQAGSDQVKRQIDLIKQTTDSDWVNAMSGDVKIAAPGVAKIGKNQKAQKKKAIK
jgi:NFACT protein C-terminal domain